MKVNTNKLLRAIKEGNLQPIKNFIENGGSVDLIAIHGFSLLSHAVLDKQHEILVYLINKGADMHKGGHTSPISVASRVGNIQALEYLIAHGAIVNDIDGICSSTLLTASCYGHLPVVKCLIENGANVNCSKEYDGCTPLMYAAILNKLQLLEYLLGIGADINAIDSYGRTAFAQAAEHGHLETIKYLMNNGADTNTVTKRGCSPVMLAAQYGHTEVLKYLLTQGSSSPDQLSTGPLK